MGSDKRAITNKAMDAELKRLGLTIQNLIDAEKKMKPGSPHYGWKGDLLSKAKKKSKKKSRVT